MNYRIIMNDGKQIVVNQLAGESILKAKSQFIRYGENMFNLKSIARVEPVAEEKYTQLPETTPKYYSQEKKVKAIESMIKGFKSAFVSREIPATSQSILDRMNKSLELAKEGKLKELSPSKIFGY
jgi:hypothetical protein